MSREQQFIRKDAFQKPLIVVRNRGTPNQQSVSFFYSLAKCPKLRNPDQIQDKTRKCINISILQQ